ncbi:MAG: hypothetical protein HUJ53_01990 [Holdemanella sp.]|nr:hypothetical protein [Holdemanella sp.]
MKQDRIGNRIYRDKKGYLIYYIPKRKIGYQIRKDQEKVFKTYRQRLSIAFVTFIFFFLLLKVNIYLSLFAAFAVYALLEYRFRKLLNTFTRVTNFTPEHIHTNLNTMKDETVSKIGLRILLYATLSILIIVNSCTNEAIRSNSLAVYASYGISAVSALFAVKYFLAIIKR